MMISTKGRYALRVMLDMAEHGGSEWHRLSDVAQRQQLSKKYLETIMAALSRANLVESAVGKSGGYRLTRSPEDYPVGEILRAVEGNLSPIACQSEDGSGCGASCAASCRASRSAASIMGCVLNSKYDSSFISRSSHGMPCSFGTFLHFGQHRIIPLRPSPDIFRRYCSSKSLKYTKYSCAFQTLYQQKISR